MIYRTENAEQTQVSSSTNNQSFGYLNINKPSGCTSHDVVAKLRKITGIKKIGHCGTLDPMASGVLVIGINQATRLFEYLPDDKTYLAKITFGLATNTDDISGEVIGKSDKIPMLSEIINILNLFKGSIIQKPPIFSALKIKGKRSYKLARDGEISLNEIKERTVDVYSIEIINYLSGILELQIHCSSGTYIRSIARDLGVKLNTYAVLSSLKRLSVGNCFIIKNSQALDLLKSETYCQYLIKPQDVINLPRLIIEPKHVADLLNGKPIKIDSLSQKINLYSENNTEIQLLDNNNNLIAIGSLKDGCMIKPKKVIAR